MLIAAFVILGATVLFGAALALPHVRSDGGAAPSELVAALHGLLAVAGLGCLVLALQGPPRGLDHGTAGFGMIAAVLIALAALFGAGFLATRLLKRRPAALLIGVHATLAVGGFVMLAAYVLAG